MTVLRDYQQRIIDGVRRAYAAGKRAPLAVAPTGAGKTVMFSYVTQAASAKGKTVYLIAHRRELIKQISLSLGRFGAAHAIVAPASACRQITVEHFRQLGRSWVKPPAQTRCFVGSVQTLVRRMNDGTLPPPDLIVIDEAHHLTVDSTWGRVVANFPDALLMPVTATPCRLDGKGLGKDAGGFADDMIIGPTVGELIRRGFLSDYRVFSPAQAIDVSKVKTRAGDYAKDQLAGLLDTPTITGDAVAHYRKLASGKRAVAFCVSVAHAEHVAEQFNAAGIPATSVDGGLDDGERERRLKAIETGEVLVLTSADLIGEGLDIPAIEVAILLRPTQSLSLYIQQVGRALRPVYAPGYKLDTDGQRRAAMAAGPKPYAIILDHVGNTARHGFPDDDRDWSLDGVKKKASKGEAEVAVRKCPECFADHRPAPACPYCGHRYGEIPDDGTGGGPKEVDGELVEITPEERQAMQAAKRREIGRARTEDELRAVAEKFGYSKGWVYNMLKARKKKEAARADA